MSGSRVGLWRSRTRRSSALAARARSRPGAAIRAALKAARLLVALAVVGTAHAQKPEDDPANWPMAGHDYAATRFSPLDQINAGNVGKLSLAFTFSTGVLRGHEAA